MVLANDPLGVLMVFIPVLDSELAAIVINNKSSGNFLFFRHYLLLVVISISELDIECDDSTF